MLAASSQAAAKPAVAGATATTKPTAAASPSSFSVVAAASPRDDAAAPDRSAFGGSRDLESQLSAAAAAAAGAGLPPLPPAASSLALARGSSLSAPLPLLDAAADPPIGEQHRPHPPLTKRVSFAEERVAALVEEATRKGGGVGCDGQRPASPPPPPPPPPPRRRRRTRDGDIPYTFSIDGPWGAPTQVSLRFCFFPGRITFAFSLFFSPRLSFLQSNLLLFFSSSLSPSLPPFNSSNYSRKISTGIRRLRRRRPPRRRDRRHPHGQRPALPGPRARARSLPELLTRKRGARQRANPPFSGLFPLDFAVQRGRDVVFRRFIRHRWRGHAGDV